MGPRAQVRSSYLQGAATRSSRGRPLGTGLRVAPPVAVRRNKGDNLTQSSCAFELKVSVCVRAPTLLGPITLFFTFFLGAGSAGGSFVLDSVERKRRSRCCTSKLTD